MVEVSEFRKWSEWTAEEDAVILANRDLMPRKELALKVGRSVSAVSSRLQQLKNRLDVPTNGHQDARPEAEERGELSGGCPEEPPLCIARRHIETAIVATADVLKDSSVIWDRGEVFHALHLLLDARDRLTGLEG